MSPVLLVLVQLLAGCEGKPVALVGAAMASNLRWCGVIIGVGRSCPAFFPLLRPYFRLVNQSVTVLFVTVGQAHILTSKIPAS